MYHRLTAILKRRVHPYALLACGLVLLVLVTGLTGMWHYRYELDHLSAPAPTVATIGYAKTGAKTTGLQPAGIQNAAVGGQAGGTGASKPNIAGTNRLVSAAAPTGTAGTAASNVLSNPVVNVVVSLSVNGSYKGQATLPSSSNQCDVLSAAYQERVIYDLDMRYNAQYKTYAVYVIDGIGDSNSVWWTYAVNGKSPPLGCSNTAVHGGDSINWQYVKG